MTEQITLEEALELVQFKRAADGSWFIGSVDGNVNGNVRGYVVGNVRGNVRGSVGGSVYGNVGGSVGGSVYGNVGGTISGKEWQFVKTPKEKLKRLIEEGADKGQLLKAVNQLKDN